MELGLKKNGTLLTLDHDRDVLLDFYEEMLDGVFYLHQEIVRKNMENFTKVTPDVPPSKVLVDELRSIGANVKKVGNSYEMMFHINSVNDRATVMESVLQIF